MVSHPSVLESGEVLVFDSNPHPCRAHEVLMPNHKVRLSFGDVGQRSNSQIAKVHPPGHFEPDYHSFTELILEYYNDDNALCKTI